MCVHLISTQSFAITNEYSITKNKNKNKAKTTAAKQFNNRMFKNVCFHGFYGKVKEKKTNADIKLNNIETETDNTTNQFGP